MEPVKNDENNPVNTMIIEQYNQCVGRRVKCMRETEGLSLENFGEILGIQKSAVSKIENGETLLSVKHALTLADRYNVTMDYLYCRTEAKDEVDTLLKYLGLEKKTMTFKAAHQIPLLRISKPLLELLKKNEETKEGKDATPKEVKTREDTYNDSMSVHKQSFVNATQKSVYDPLEDSEEIAFIDKRFLDDDVMLLLARAYENMI